MICNPGVDYFGRNKANWFRYPSPDDALWPVRVNPNEHWMGQDNKLYGEGDTFCGLLYTSDQTKFNRTIRIHGMHDDPVLRRSTNIFLTTIECYKFHWKALANLVSSLWKKLTEAGDGFTQQTELLGFSHIFHADYIPGEYKFLKVIFYHVSHTFNVSLGLLFSFI